MLNFAVSKWYVAGMAFPEWKIISRLGSQVARRLPELADLAVTELDGGGRVLSINSFGKRAWGWSNAVRAPNSVLIGLSELRAGESGLLPIKVGGLTVLGIRVEATGGWLLIGYRPDDERIAATGSRFKSLIEKIPVSITMLRVDGTVIYANSEVERMTGYGLDQVIGRPFWLEAVHPEDRWKLMGALRHAIEGERAMVGVRFLSKRRGLRLAEMHLYSTRDDTETMLESVVFDVTERSEVEDALFQSEALYRTFLEQSPIGMLHLDSAGTVTFENHQLRQIIGESAEDAWIGRTIYSINGLEARLFPLLRNMLDDGKAFHGEQAAYRNRGTVQHLAVHGSPIQHPEGGIVGGVLMIEDRTEERRREDELHLRNRYATAESALRKAALADPNEDAFLQEAACILGETAKADRVYLLLNNAAADCCTNRARWWAETEDEPKSLVIMQQEHSVLNDIAQSRTTLHVSARAEASAQVLLELTGASESVWAPFYDEGQLGGFALFERTHITTDGAPGAWNDTELGLMEQLVRLFETLWTWILAGNRYRHITATIDDCLFNFTFNEDGERRYLFATPQIQSLTGYRVDEIAARGEALIEWSDVIVHEDDREAIDMHDETLRKGRESRITYRVQHRNGSVRWLQEHATPQQDAMGDVIVSGILTDVSEQKAAEAVLTESKQQAESANRLKSAFIATMSHEIRTPMGAVNGFAELLTRELAEVEAAAGEPLPEQVTEFLQAIRENSQKLLTLVNDLFDLSNLEVGSINLRRISIPLHDVIMRSTSKIAVALSQKGIDLRVDLDKDDPVVLGDPQRLEQVIDNLLSNAAKFTDDGSVTVRTRSRRDGRAEIEVTDTGVGISDEYADSLFTPFVQEDSRLNRRFEGSGLGLSLVKRLLVLMEGEIEVESEKGEGSTFRIILPMPKKRKNALTS